MKRIIVLFCIAICLVSCGKKQVEKKSEVSSPSPSISAELPDPTPAITALPRSAKKTVQEAFASLWEEDKVAKKQKLYFSKEYDSVRFDDVAAWKDARGNYICPEGYEVIGTMTSTACPEEAAQQMPPELLKELDTEELYQLMMKAPGYNSASRYESYLVLLYYYHQTCNFLQDFMQREDSAEVVHKYYQQYSKKERKRLSKEYELSLSQEGITEEEVGEIAEKMGKFRMTEALEWFFLYADGKEVPDETLFGLHVIEGVNH